MKTEISKKFPFILGLVVCVPLGCSPSEERAATDATLIPDSSGPDTSVPELPDARDDLGAADLSDTADGMDDASDVGIEDATVDTGRGEDVAPIRCPECTEGQVCRPDRGTCAGTGAVICAPACSPGTTCGLELPPVCLFETCAERTEFPSNVLKLTKLALPTEPNACEGQGNALGELVRTLPIIGTLLEGAVANDRATILVEPAEFSSEGGDGRLTWLFGTLSPDNLRCDTQSNDALCSYTASRDSWDRGTPGTGPCTPWISQPSTWVSSGFPGTIDPVNSPSETASAPGDRLQFAIPIAGGHVLLQLHRPRLDAKVQTAVNALAAGPGWMGLDGKLCGILPMSDLRAALFGLPADVLETLGGIETAFALLDANLSPDTDLDGDGDFDGVSAVLDFEASRARLVGLSPE